MLCRHEIVRELGEDDRRWVARCQMFAVFLFLAILAGVVLWSAVAPNDPPAGTIDPAIAVRATASVDADDDARAP